MTSLRRRRREATQRHLLLSYTNKLNKRNTFRRFGGNKTNNVTSKVVFQTLLLHIVVYFYPQLNKSVVIYIIFYIFSYMETKAAAVLNAVPPYGHLIASEKWTNSSLIQRLKGN